jgi:hypothetical protein
MGDCPVCHTWFGEHPVGLCCESGHLGAHRECAERLSRELLSPLQQERYSKSPQLYWFCRRPDNRCLKAALKDYDAREDIRNAMQLAETNKSAAIQALKEIQSHLRDYKAREQISRAIAAI